MTAGVEGNLNPLFSSPDGDTTLVSRDQISFRTHSFILKNASGFFREKYNQPQSRTPADDVLPLDEGAEILEHLLRMISGLPLLPITDFEKMEKILSAAEKYDMPGPISVLRYLARTPPFWKEPLRVYAMAHRHGWEEVKKLASTETLKLDLFDPVFREALLQIPSEALWDLVCLRHKRKELLVEKMGGWPTFKWEEDEDEYEDEDDNACCCSFTTNPNTWEGLKMRIILEFEKRPAGDTIVDDLRTDRWPEAKAEWEEGSCHCGAMGIRKTTRIAMIERRIKQLPISV